MLGHELEEAIIIENDSEFLFDYDHLELNLCSIAVERYLSLSKIALERSRQDFEFRRETIWGIYLIDYCKLNVLMETKGGKKSSSSSSSKSFFYEAPLGYSIEDVRPNGGIKKFRSAAYSNCARKPS
ncbi:hypothetical protein ACET3Z_030122 [Daucus carota]